MIVYSNYSGLSYIYFVLYSHEKTKDTFIIIVTLEQCAIKELIRVLSFLVGFTFKLTFIISNHLLLGGILG